MQINSKHKNTQWFKKKLGEASYTLMMLFTDK